jgi:hypothetical protein
MSCYPKTVYKAVATTWILTVEEADGDRADLTGAEIELRVKLTDDAADPPLILITHLDDITVLAQGAEDATRGQAQVYLDASQTSGLGTPVGKYRYVVRVRMPGGDWKFPIPPSDFYIRAAP